MNTTIVFAPHQGDELFIFGREILVHLGTLGHEVHVVSMTKGDVGLASCPNGTCEPERAAGQLADMDGTAMMVARDKELFESCIGLGVPVRNIHLYHHRPHQNALTPECAADIMSFYLEMIPNANIVAPSPFGDAAQPYDHKAAGLAALRLAERRPGAGALFVLDPRTTPFAALTDGIPFTQVNVSRNQIEALATAAQAYCAPQGGAKERSVGEALYPFERLSEYSERLVHGSERCAPLVFDQINLMASLLQERDRRLESLLQEHDALRREAGNLHAEMADLESSWSMRIGLVATAPFRTIRRLASRRETP